MGIKKVVYIIIGGILASLYILNFSLWFWPEFNSDHAIHILMAEHFDYRKDWYYWGQNRLGSFLPFLASLLVHLGLDAFNAYGIVQLLVIAGCLWFLFRLIKEPIWFLVAAALLLFPIYPYWMQLAPGHPYLAQFFFILAAFYLFFIESVSQKLKYALGPLMLALAIWSSELSVAALIAMGLVNFKTLIGDLKKNWYWFLASSAIGLKLLLEFKAHAVRDERYAELLTDFPSFMQSLSTQWEQFQSLILFDGNKPLNGGLALFMITLAIFGLVYAILYKKKPSFLSLTLMGTAVLSFILIHASAWNDEMGMPHRYFTMPYFFGFLSLILLLRDLFPKPVLKYPIGVVMISLLLYASITFNHQFETGAINRIRAEEARTLLKKVFAENPQVEGLSVIGSYWNSHLPDALSTKVNGIPFKGEHLREMSLIEKADQNDYFLLIRNNWLPEFPLYIQERDWLLKRIGEPDDEFGIYSCLYQKVEKYGEDAY